MKDNNTHNADYIKDKQFKTATGRWLTDSSAATTESHTHAERPTTQ